MQVGKGQQDVIQLDKRNEFGDETEIARRTVDRVKRSFCCVCSGITYMKMPREHSVAPTIDVKCC